MMIAQWFRSLIGLLASQARDPEKRIAALQAELAATLANPDLRLSERITAARVSGSRLAALAPDRFSSDTEAVISALMEGIDRQESRLALAYLAPASLRSLAARLFSTPDTEAKAYDEGAAKVLSLIGTEEALRLLESARQRQRERVQRQGTNREKSRAAKHLPPVERLIQQATRADVVGIDRELAKRSRLVPEPTAPPSKGASCRGEHVFRVYSQPWGTCLICGSLEQLPCNLVGDEGRHDFRRGQVRDHLGRRVDDGSIYTTCTRCGKVLVDD